MPNTRTITSQTLTEADYGRIGKEIITALEIPHDGIWELKIVLFDHKRRLCAMSPDGAIVSELTFIRTGS